MKREEYVAIVVVLCAALIGASVMLRDVTGITGAATANLPPAWQADSTKFALATNTPLALNLDALFKDPEGSELTFISTQTKNLAIAQDGNTLVITPEPGFAGERVITVIASDGEHIATKRLKIEIGDGFAPTALPATAPQPEPALASAAVPAPQEEEFPSAATPAAPDKVEDEVEEALADEETVEAIIVLKNDQPQAFAAQASRAAKQQALENIKNEVDENREELLDRVNDVPAITGAVTAGVDFEITHEYETLNAIAVKLTRPGLAKLRNDPLVEQIVLDREFTVDLTDSIPLIDANDVWNLTVNNANLTGKGEVICILDTGIDFPHPAFTDKAFTGYDFRNEDDNPQDDAFNSHGTHVAGIALGNSSAVKGVAPDAKVLPAKVCDNTGSCTGSDLLAGIDFCNNKSATVNISAMSVSIGDGGQYNSTTCPTSFDAALNTSVSLGIIPVFASGNNGYTAGISFPACSPYSLSVGSTTKSDAISSFTNRGGDRLDILAPGSGIISSVIGGGTGSLSGTSMATPHVSGLIALIQQNQRAQGRPVLSIAEMRALLQATGKEITLWNRINAYAAIIQLNQNYTVNITDNSVTNISPPKAKIKFKDATDLSNIADCTDIRHNFAGIDSVACPQFNKSAHIMFEGLAGDTATPLRNNEACPASICQNITFASGTLDFDVTEFSNFSSQSNFSTQDVVTNCDPGPVIINTSTTLTNSISSNGTCLTTNASNIVIDCDGFSIGFNANGSGNANEFGINLTRASGVTVRDCVINDLNGTGANGDAAILTYLTNYSTFVNNTIVAFNGSYAIYIDVAHNNTFANNTLANGSMQATTANVNNITGNLFNLSGIGLLSLSRDNLIAFNTILSRTGGIDQSSGNSFIRYNNITIRSDLNDRRGVDTDPAGPFDVTGNRIEIHTNGTNAVAFRLASSSGNFSNNTFFVNGSVNAKGLTVEASATGTFTGNNFTVLGNSSAGILFEFSIINTTHFQDTIISAEGRFIELDPSGGSAVTGVVNFTNTTFVMPNGSINILGLAQLNGTQNVTLRRLNITFNRAYLNSSNLSFLNQTGIVTLNGITASDPNPQFDFEDDGTFADCTSTANPFCTELSYAGGVFTFNTSHFTTFQATESGAVSLTGCATINTSATLAQNLSSNGTCITIGASNTVLNCNGYTVFFDAAGTGGDGVFASLRNNITIRDCILRDINQSGTGGYGIFLSGTENSTATNNTIFTNGTTDSTGITLSGASFNNITLNVITTNGSGSESIGISLANSDNNSISNNTIRTNGAGGGNYGIEIDTAANFNNVTFNNILTNSTGVTGANYGIRLNADSNDASQNIIVTSGPQGSNIGIRIEVGGNTVTGNSVTTTDNVTANCGNHGITAFGGSNTIATNTILASCNGGVTFGIFLLASSNNVTHNTVTVTGTSTVRGISTTSSGSNNISHNNVRVLATNITNFGIDLGGVGGNAITNNTIFVTGNETSVGINIETNSGLNNIGHNRIIANGTRHNIGVRIHNTQATSHFLANNISANGTASYGITISIANNTVFNSTLLDDPTHWINSTFDTRTNFTNTAFQMPDGSITLLSNFTVETIEVNVTKGKLNITSNRAFLNSSNLTFLNTSAQITLFGATTPQQLVDFEDDGTFEFCPANVCSLVSFAGSTLIFNVTHFTTFSSTVGNSNITLTKTDSPDPVNASSNLSYSILINVTSDSPANITLTDQYPSQVIFLTAQPAPLAGTNNTFIIGNLTNGTTFTVNITVLVLNVSNGTVINNTANISFHNATGIQINASVNESTTVLAAVAAFLTGAATINTSTNLTQNITTNGTAITFGNDSITLDCQGFSILYNANGSDNAFGIAAVDRTNITVRNCVIRDINASGQRGYGINFTRVNASTILNTTISTNGTSRGYGILFNNASHNTAANITIRTQGTSSINTGIVVEAASNNNTIRESVVFSNGTSNDNGISIFDSSNTTLANNSINAQSASTGEGILLQKLGGISVFDNIMRTTFITTAGEFGSNTGIHIHGANYTVVEDTVIRTNGNSTSNYGMLIDSGSEHTNVTRILIITNGTGNNEGIDVSTQNTFVRDSVIITGEIPNAPLSDTGVNHGIETRRGNTFRNITIRTFGPYSSAIEISSGGTANLTNYFNDTILMTDQGTPDNVSYGVGIAGNTGTNRGRDVFVNTLLNNTGNWIANQNNTETNFTNTTFQMPNGSIRIPGQFRMTGIQEINKSRLNISSNRAYANSTNLTYLNTTAVITLNNITASDPKPRVAFDDSTFADCTSTADPFCTELGYSGGAFSYNTSHFTTYSSSESTAVITGCAAINVSTALAQNILANETCISINASNLVFSCAGFSIGGNLTGNGIQVANATNVTVRDCLVENFSTNVHFNNTNNSAVQNVTGRNSTTHSFRIGDGIQNLIANSTFTTLSSGNGMIVQAHAVNVTLENNTAFSDGGVGIGTANTVRNSTLLNNRATSNQSSGININGLNITLHNNHGTGNGGGASIAGENHSIINNTFSSPTETATFITGSHNTFINNTYTTNTNRALFLPSGTNNTFIDTTLRSNNTWIEITSGTGNNVTLTRFVSDAGSIRILATATLPPSGNVSIARLNITNNNAYLNSTNLTYLNTTAVITLNNITASDPKPRVAFDDSTFADCTSTADPFCTEISYAGGTFVFNTSHFTAFSSTEGGVNITLTKTDSPDPVNTSGTLNYTIIVNVTSDSPANVTLTDTYPADVIFITAQPTPITGTNNTFILGNLTSGTVVRVNITVLVLNISNGTVINNTANISFHNQTGATITANVTASTTVLNPPVFNLSNISVIKTDSPDSVNTSANLTYVINVAVTGNGTSYNITVNDTYPAQVIFLSSQPTAVSGTNNTFILGNLTNGTNILVNITVLVLNISNGTVINNTVNVTFQNETGALLSRTASANTTVTNFTFAAAPAAPAGQGGGNSGGGNGGGGQGGVKYDLNKPQPESPACVESWACEDWSRCENGIRVRNCVDQNNCGTHRLKPGTGIICETPVEEQAAAAPQTPAPKQEPLELPALQVPQTESKPETLAIRLCAILPTAINGALLVLAVLVLLYWVHARKGNGRAVRTTADIVSIIILGALIAEYVLCKTFLPAQYGAFVVLVLAIIAEHLVALARGRAAAPSLPAPEPLPAHEEALQPAPVPAMPARIAAPVLKQAAESPPTPISPPVREERMTPLPAPAPKKPYQQPPKAAQPEKTLKAQKFALPEGADAELREVFSSLQGSGDALEQFNKRLAQIEKNLSKHAKKRKKR